MLTVGRLKILMVDKLDLNYGMFVPGLAGHPALPDRGHTVWQNVAIPFFNFLVLAMFIFIGISIIKHTTSRVCGKTTDNHRLLMKANTEPWRVCAGGLNS